MDSEDKNIASSTAAMVNDEKNNVEQDLRRPESMATLTPAATAPKDARFWMIFASLLVATFIAALDMTGKSQPYLEFNH